MILITGATTGIGFATAKALAEKGYSVLAGYRNQKDISQLQIKNIQPIQLDVTSSSDLENLKKYLQDEKIELNCVINNAGILTAGPLEFVPVDEVKKVFDVNVWGLLNVTQICLPYLRQTKGKVINISSIAGRTVTPFLGPYNASKYCVEVITDALRMEMQESGVQFVLIEPGSIETPIWQKSMDFWKLLIEKLPHETFKYYGRSLKSFEMLVQKTSSHAAPVSRVVSKIISAVESQNPSSRYLVGRDAQLALIQNYLPTKLKDKLIWKVVNSQRS